MDFVNILNIWKFYSVHGCVSGLLVLKYFGVLLRYIYLWFIIFIYTVLIKWLVAYKCGYRSGIK